MIIQLARVNPKIGPAKAMEILNKVQEQFGDLPPFASTRPTS